ncbi:amino acid ABC transporter permease [Bifidobacterium ramosum]|uniref:Amino acid ABC transporter permease n=1 Tax=Bifidobacterium ramosum TaxID=1798158 RepID=A0A6L4X3W1_9BIFI|nr:hypothetical protein [Bifidobacterium ramosum]KAB8289416.1 amino acid ABC transporter permease [Bifidobacterium ramosum]NEG71113.1 hypothetical protein [Bifidobacterium ramosum]
MNRLLEVAVCVLTVVLVSLSGLMAVFVLGDGYFTAMREYPKQGRLLSLSDVPQDRSDRTLDALLDTVGADGGVVVRSDLLTSPVDGSAGGYRLGVYGDVTAHASAMRLRYLGASVLDEHNLSRLMEAANENATLGLDQVRPDMIADLPGTHSGVRLVVERLDTLVRRSGTVNGDYRIVGLDDGRFRDLVSRVSEASGIPGDQLTSASSGSSVTDSFMTLVTLALIAVASLALTLIVVLGTFQEFSRLGVYMLLGWSRTGYAAALYRPFLLFLPAVIPIPVLVMGWGLTGFPVTPQLVLAVLAPSLATAVIVLLALGCGLLALLSVRPVAAIRNRVSKRAMLAVIAIVYVLASAGLVAGAHALDAPMDGIRNLTQVSAQWSRYRSMRILYKDSRGTNHTSTSGLSGDHAKEIYDWYASIEHDDGVYLANTRYFSRDLVASWRHLYQQVPEQAFWYFAMSPSYLAAQGFAVDPDATARAEAGERVYLIPDTMPRDEQERMRGYLTETSMTYKTWESSVHTTFMDTGTVGFAAYHPSTPLFTWSDDPDLPSNVTDPVILLATSANMTPFETESLGAVGLTNSYIKLDESAAQRYTTPDYLAKYQLEDNNPVFRTTADFIAGMRKNLTEFLQLFGGLAITAMIFQLIGVATLCRIYAMTYRETIAVKRLLGYPLRRIFAPAFTLIVTVSAVALLAALLLGSKAGIIAAGATMLFQLILMTVQSRTLATSQLQTMIKTE